MPAPHHFLGRPRPQGKTEAWVVLEADPDAAVYLGFSRDVEAAVRTRLP